MAQIERVRNCGSFQNGNIYPVSKTKRKKINIVKSGLNTYNAAKYILLSFGNPFAYFMGVDLNKWAGDYITPPGVEDYEMIVAYDKSAEFDELWSNRRPLEEEYANPNDYEIELFNGTFTVFTTTGNRKTPVDVKTPLLKSHLEKLHSLYNKIYKDNLGYFLRDNKEELKRLYTSIIKPGTHNPYTQLEADARIDDLIDKSGNDAFTIDDLMNSLVEDGIIDVHTGSVLNSNTSRKSKAVSEELEKIYQANACLNGHVNANVMDRNFASNLANAMKEKRKVYVGPPILGARRRALVSWGYMNVIGKRVVQAYRSLFSERVKIRSAIRGNKSLYKFGRDKSKSFSAKYQSAKLKIKRVNPSVQEAIVQKVENFRQHGSSIKPTLADLELYNHILTVRALQEIEAIDPEFKLLGEMFQAYYENLYVVRNDDTLLSERMNDYFKEMLDLASKRSLAIHQDRHGQKAGDPFLVTPADREHLYKILRYILPTEKTTNIPIRRAVPEKVMAIYNDIANDYQELADCKIAENEWYHVGHIQQLLFDELT